MASFPPSKLARRAAALTTAGAAALVLAGCYGPVASTGVQRDVVGNVDVTTDFCPLTGGPFAPLPSCTTGDESEPAAQLFVSYLVPDGEPDPTVAGSAKALATAHFTKASADVSAATLDGTGTRPGMHWVTYQSDAISTDQADPNGSVTASFDTAKLDGDLTIATASAWRWVDPATAGWGIDRPVTCGLPTWNGTITAATECGNLFLPPTPTPAPTDVPAATDTPEATATPTPFVTPFFPPIGTPLSTPFIPTPTPDPSRSSTQRIQSATATPEPTATDEPDAIDTPAPTPQPLDTEFLQTIPISRLAVTAPEPVTVAGGAVAHVTFAQSSHLASGLGSASVPLAATSSVPGGTASVAGSLAIGSSDAVSVDVTVPAGTPAGDYDVALQAGAASGLRSATATLHVTAAPVVASTGGTPTPIPAPLTVPQKLAASAGDLGKALTDPKRSQALRKGKVVYSLSVPVAGTVRVSVVGPDKGKKKGPVLAVGKAKATTAGLTEIAIKRTADGRRLLAGHKDIQATLVVRLWYPGGKVVSTAVPFTLTAED